MWYWERRGPMDVKGGIKLQSKRGESARSWWGQKWNAILYSSMDEGRLSRGRTYARRGQVRAIDIGRGVVRGTVQGSYSSPYTITIKVDMLKPKEWDRVADSLMARPSIAARLMAGQMPQDMEAVFRDAGLSLFPNKIYTDCSCYDYANPCKHIAAIYLILSEQFDRDPFLIFKLRGMGQKELLGKIGIQPMEVEVGGSISALVPDMDKDEPLPLEAGLFWGRESARMDVGRVDVSELTAAMPRRLGGFPFWRSKESFFDALDYIYGNASSIGLSAFLGEGNQDPAKTK